MAIISDVTVADVRVRSGEKEERLSDAEITTLIEDSEKDVEKHLNSKLQGTYVIDYLDGSGDNRISLKHAPVLAIRAIKSDGTTIDADDIFIYERSGMIILKTSASVSLFTSKAQGVLVKYYYGYLEQGTTQTTTSAAATAGSSVTLRVASESGFSTGDWVAVEGMDYKERAIVTSTDSNEITVDVLAFDHESNSIVTKLEINGTIEDLIIVEAAIKVAQAMLSITATDKSRYVVDDIEQAFGEAYAQWNAALKSLKIERTEIKKKVGRISYVTR